MSAETVKAAWSGPFEGDLGPRQPPLKVGDVIDVTPEMLESGHWTPVEAPQLSPSPTPSVTRLAATPTEGTV